MPQLHNRITEHLPAGPAPCAIDFHLGPFDAAPGLARFLGAEWCRCRCCGSVLTRDTAEHRRPAAA